MAAEAGTARPARRTWDVVLAIALAVVLVALAALLGFAGVFLVMASDSCGSTTGVACRTDQLSAGVLVAVAGPAVVAVIAIASVVERLVRARLAFWPPLVGIVVASLVFVGGAALVFTVVPSS